MSVKQWELPEDGWAHHCPAKDDAFVAHKYGGSCNYCGIKRIEQPPVEDHGYEQWKQYHERWVREQNERALETESKLGNLVKGKPYRTGTFGWWCQPDRTKWGHKCSWAGWTRGDIFHRADVAVCDACRVQRPESEEPRSWWVNSGRPNLGWRHACFGKDEWTLLPTTEFCGNCGVERPQTPTRSRL